ncbi:MAG: helix-turn-helix domain-containing protein [Dehalococcoidia bacterium]
MEPAAEGELTVSEAAQYLGRSLEQVRRYLREGRLAGYRVGNQWFVPAAALASLRALSQEQEDHMKLVKEMQALRAELLRKYGYLDVTTWVAEAREGLR